MIESVNSKFLVSRERGSVTGLFSPCVIRSFQDSAHFNNNQRAAHEIALILS
jgi:hypothetical protein